MKTILTAVIAVISVVSCSVNPTTEPEPTEIEPSKPPFDGAELYESKTCFRCHGMNAKIPVEPNYPKLAGQIQPYLLQQMKDIKSGARANGETGAMKPTISTVNEEEMKAIADWLSSLSTTVTMPANMSMEGAKLYQSKECSDCHGDDANDNETEKTPKLAGQKADYLLQQMKDYKSGKRANSRAKRMKKNLSDVNENEMTAIAEWLSTLK
ncbi:MAG: c-type cytochrome [Pseudomonadota bacterium]